jgi:stress-induced-phosphoprotein 1
MFDAGIWGKMAANPKLAPLLAQPDLVQKIQAIQANPKSINQYMQDPRMMNLIMGLMGLDATATTEPGEFERNRAEAQAASDDADAPSAFTAAAPPSTPRKREAAPTPASPPKDLTEEERARQASNALKDQGNQAYKARKFEEALALYQQAWEADATNIAVLTNKSAVLFEMGSLADTPARDAECLACCEEAVEKGREVRADFKLIARAFARMAAVYQRQGDLDQAIKYYEKSLSEHRTPDTLAKLKEAEKAKATAAKRAYHDPALADQAREEGNELFKASKFAEAVKCYTEAIKRNDTDPRNYSNRAACYTKLMALPEADKDCDAALALDAGFVKAHIRKAAIQMAKRDFAKALELCALAKEKDVEGKHAAEIDGLVGWRSLPVPPPSVPAWARLTHFPCPITAHTPTHIHTPRARRCTSATRV